MNLDLVHCRQDTCLLPKDLQLLLVEIADPDGPDQAFLIQFFHSPPRTVIIIHRLVDQI